ncbi:glycosyltransferase family 2 protein [Bacteroides sp. AN502(2024)]|uniref:glycosyltransferase family 2 protein n=1 Tax=Bacteroides sp. AN502(2024) TaxID=3160599 RepID=UPI003515D2F3
MKNPVISIIIPVYNAEEYLRRCLDSFVAQTFTDWEVWLIDDGSTDRSGAICDEYADRDSRFCVIHKENGGVASARQAGVDNARGEYSIHADADDFVEPAMLADMLSYIRETGADLVVTDFYGENKRGFRYVSRQRPTGNTTSQLIDDVIHGRVHGSLCNKLMRHDLYKKYNLRFFNGVDYCEDVLILAQLARHSQRVVSLTRAYYHYCYAPKSITRDISIKTYNMQKEYVKMLDKIGGGKSYLVRLAAHRAKLDALRNGLMTRDEYYSFFPSCKDVCIDTPNLESYLFGVTALGGHYRMAVAMFRTLQFFRKILSFMLSPVKHYLTSI